VAISLGITFLVYCAVAVSALLAAGPAGLAATAAPLRAAVRAGSLSGLAPVVQVGAAIAALGSLLSLILGVSRTTMAMARDRHLPRALAAVHPRYAVPHRAEVAVGVVVVALVSTLDLRGAIGFSSFGVLVYYAIANLSALTLTRAERRPPRVVPVLGVTGCLVLALSLPLGSVLAGAGVTGAGALLWLARRRSAPSEDDAERLSGAS
jgi:basic amino acid/polyamine antiporter, APA family